MAKLLFFAGSARKESMNKKLARYAYEKAKSLGADAQFIDLADYPMPLYCQDIEAESGLPENAIKLKELFIESDGFYIASPEYNSSYTPLLKNTIDWISRPHTDNEPMLHAYTHKAAAIGATSPGALGGIRGLVPLRMLLGNINVTVVPAQAAIGNYAQAFDENGKLTIAPVDAMLTTSIQQLIDAASALSTIKNKQAA